jgi:hypothetical protein
VTVKDAESWAELDVRKDRTRADAIMTMMLMPHGLLLLA